MVIGDIRNGVTKEAALVGLSLSLHTWHYHIGRFRDQFEPKSVQFVLFVVN